MSWKGATGQGRSDAVQIMRDEARTIRGDTRRISGTRRDANIRENAENITEAQAGESEVMRGHLGPGSSLVLSSLIRAQRDGIMRTPRRGGSRHLSLIFSEMGNHNTPTDGQIGGSLRRLSLAGYPIKVIRPYVKNGKGTPAIYEIGRLVDEA